MNYKKDCLFIFKRGFDLYTEMNKTAKEKKAKNY